LSIGRVEFLVPSFRLENPYSRAFGEVLGGLPFKCKKLSQNNIAEISKSISSAESTRFGV